MGHFRWTAAALFAALLLPACDDGDSGGGGTAQVPDFLLLDENPGSASHQASVSPRDYMGKTPGFYFTHAS